MRFLILGCNGMAGHLISVYLKDEGHDVTGFARTKSYLVDCIIGDAKDEDYIRKIINEGNYDYIVNCIGLLNQFAEADKADAVYLNSYLPHLLAKITESMTTQVIHISTDCVFSGEKGQYSEDEIKDGKSFYDRSKALGELDDNKNLTLRQSIIGPDIKKDGIGLLNWFMQQHDTVYGYTGAIWTGQTTLQLAKTIEYAANNHIVGLYNMVPSESITKYELLNLFNKYFRNGSINIIPLDKMAADKSLIRKRDGFNYTIPDYDQMVAELSIWVKAHKTIYSHYNL